MQANAVMWRKWRCLEDVSTPKFKLNNQGGIQDFELIDEMDKAYELPVAQIKEFWNRGFFGGFNSLKPLFTRSAPLYRPLDPDPDLASKGTGPEAQGRNLPDPRSPYIYNYKCQKLSQFS
jgi:hypothetical protein